MSEAPVGRHDRRFGYAMAAPALLILVMVALFPLVWTLVVSLQNISMIDEDTSFQGLLNYQRIFTDTRFWAALVRTLVFTAVALPLELIGGLLLALLFLDHLPGRQIFVALLVLPTVISPIVAGAAWRLLFDNRFGPVNQIISWIAGHDVTILWLNDPIFVYVAILLTEIWQWTPFMFLLLFASLSNVDPSLAEAARIDGAGFWRILWSVTIPVIRPVIIIALLIRGLDLFRIFDIIWALTKGGPGTRTETVSIFAYIQGFQQFETSYTAALALVIIVILTVIVMAALRRVEIAR